MHNSWPLVKAGYKRYQMTGSVMHFNNSLMNLQIKIIRSLCEVEFTLDSVAGELHRTLTRSSRSRVHSTYEGEPFTCGRVPSYVSIPSCGGGGSGALGGGGGFSSGRQRAHTMAVASSASLLNLASLDAGDKCKSISPLSTL